MNGFTGQHVIAHRAVMQSYQRSLLICIATPSVDQTNIQSIGIHRYVFL